MVPSRVDFGLEFFTSFLQIFFVDFLTFINEDCVLLSRTPPEVSFPDDNKTVFRKSWDTENWYTSIIKIFSFSFKFIYYSFYFDYKND